MPPTVRSPDDLNTAAMSLNLDYPPVTRGPVILWGMLGAMPFGGMVWQVYHYAVPLRRLGYDVWYVEDSDRFVYDPVNQNPTMECAANVALLAGYMDRVGLGDRWVFRAPGTRDEVFGATDHRGLLELYRNAEFALNLCGAQEPLEHHASIACRIYLETDPVENQVAVAKGHTGVIDALAAHDILFSYGENLGSPDCPVPMERFEWRPTRPPVSPDLWTVEGLSPGRCMTTVATWSHRIADAKGKGYDSKDVTWEGHVWRWSKHHEVLKVMSLPERSPLPLEMAVGSIGKDDLGTLEQSGWRTRPASSLNDPSAYRDYILGSRGEFTVAKDQYVSPRSGWFSDRSVCYLAAGRPVVTQETGFSKFVPVGEGLFSWTTPDEALEALEVIAGDYPRQSAAAADVAREYFDGEKVLKAMLSSAGLL